MSERSRLRAARHAAEKRGVSSAIQRTTRQSPYKMRLVIDQIRGKDVNEALGLLRFSKKHAAKQVEKVLTSAVANAEYRSRSENESVDVDTLYIKHEIVLDARAEAPRVAPPARKSAAATTKTEESTPKKGSRASRKGSKK